MEIGQRSGSGFCQSIAADVKLGEDVQIYNFETAWRTGPVDAARQRTVYAQPTPTVEAVWDAWQTVRTARP